MDTVITQKLYRIDSVIAQKLYRKYTVPLLPILQLTIAFFKVKIFMTLFLKFKLLIHLNWVSNVYY